MQLKTRITLAGAIGNLLEWYDFGLYGLLAPLLAKLFFPPHEQIAALLSVYAGFAAGFAMRPLGAVVLGHLGDRVGRRFVLTLSVLLMGISTVAIGLLPTYNSIGIWAAVLLITIRLFQGFSVGGEFVDSVTYMVEAAPPGRRGIAGSVANIGSTAGLLLAAGVAALVVNADTSSLATSWRWRIPFLFGGVIACAAYVLRRHLPETREEVAAEAEAHTTHEAPIWQAIRCQPRIVFAALLFTSGYGIVDYLTMVFLPTFANQFGHVAEDQALRINAIGQALALFAVPTAGWISDRLWRRRTIATAAFIVEGAFAWEGFRIVQQHGVSGVWPAQLIFALLLSAVMGTAPALLAEQFASAYRVSAHAVTFNIGIGIAGGTAPLVAVALIKATSQPMAAAIYLIFGAALAVAGALLLSDNSREKM